MQRAASFLPKRVGAWQDTRYACRLRFTGNVSQNKCGECEMCQIVGVNSLSAESTKPWQKAALMGATA